jgi:hypothetical protein
VPAFKTRNNESRFAYEENEIAVTKNQIITTRIFQGIEIRDKGVSIERYKFGTPISAVQKYVLILSP